MKRILAAALSLLAFTLFAADDETNPGLVAHYFQDPEYWDGNWPDNQSLPNVPPSEWTFRRYAYSRVEPVVNHLFARQGWFSIRWKGLFNPANPGSDSETLHTIGGQINLNPNNSDRQEFSLTLPDGRVISRDDLDRRFRGYAGPALKVRIQPKGNANQNSLLVDDEPFPLLNGQTYEISSESMTVNLSNDRAGANRAAGSWWLAINAVRATIRFAGQPAAASNNHADDTAHDCYFDLFADDGCRLFIDGNCVIDDWIACSEALPAAWRRSGPVPLRDGQHEIVIEYFQGQSLPDNDADPIRLYWSCPSRGVTRQIVPQKHFSHAARHATSPAR